jgi:hypothetical protein
LTPQIVEQWLHRGDDASPLGKQQQADRADVMRSQESEVRVAAKETACFVVVEQYTDSLSPTGTACRGQCRRLAGIQLWIFCGITIVDDRDQSTSLGLKNRRRTWTLISSRHLLPDLTCDANSVGQEPQQIEAPDTSQSNER